MSNENLISRQVAIEALAEDMPKPYTPDGSHPADDGIFMAQEIYADCIQTLKDLPSAQQEPTLEQIEEYCHKRCLSIVDNALLHKYAQVEINCSEIPNASDFVSRKAVRDMVSAWAYDMMEQEDLNMALHDVDELPPVSAERQGGKKNEGHF